MRTYYDRLTKWTLGPVLEKLGEVVTEAEVVDTAHRVDFAYKPDVLKVEAEEPGDVIEEMLERPALIEHFARSVREKEIEVCVLKQLLWVRGLNSRARVEARKRGESKPAPQPTPRLWILSAGRPVGVRDGRWTEPLPGWPAGFYKLPFEDGGLVVLSELPRNRATIILRLLGPDEVRWQATEDLLALPDEAFERVALPGIRRWYGGLMAQTARTKKQKSLLQENLDWLKDHERQLKDEGREEALKKVLAGLLEQKFGELTAPRRAQLESANSTKLNSWLARVLEASEIDEVFSDESGAE